MASQPPPPPPPRHGPYQKASELPTGNYDIFVIPPHSSGSGFLYLPSLQPHRNSFLAGVASTLLAMGLWSLIVPVLKLWLSRTIASGGVAVLLVIMGVGILGWAFGKTQAESTGPEVGEESAKGDPGSAGHGAYGASGGAPPNTGPKPTWQQPRPPPATSEWEKMREETRKREEERKKGEKKEEMEKKAKEAAEAEKWAKAKAREKEIREREVREKVAKERREREQRDKEAKEHLDKSKDEGSGVGTKAYQKPTAQSFAGDDETYSFRPYDTPKRATGTNSQSSASESSYAPSQSTARTTPPPSQRGPYATKDAEKIVIDAVYAFNDKFQKATAQLISGTGSVTDGLVLKLTTEGLFIDDDVRNEPQREWDVKAWTIKLIEVSCYHALSSLAVDCLLTCDAEW